MFRSGGDGEVVRAGGRPIWCGLLVSGQGVAGKTVPRAPALLPLPLADAIGLVCFWFVCLC
jgi:hypothetical protein